MPETVSRAKQSGSQHRCLELTAKEKGAPKDALNGNALTAIKRSCDDDAGQPERRSPLAEALQQQEQERQQPR